MGPVKTNQEAVTAVERTRPDLAILDLTLREREAGQVVDQLRDRGVPFIVLSGQSQTDAAAQELGDALWLEKPSGVDQIEAAIHTVACQPESTAVPATRSA
jgi:DNA-binding response OmpR family regulator